MREGLDAAIRDACNLWDEPRADGRCARCERPAVARVQTTAGWLCRLCWRIGAPSGGREVRFEEA